jgi:hypothetical protein
MKKLFELIFNQKDESEEWIITRMRRVTQSPIGPRYPTGLFRMYNPKAVK